MMQRPSTDRWTLAQTGLLTFFLLVAGVLTPASLARAEPYIAVREGLKCSVCHVNKTGGGKRTAEFNSVAKGFLHYPSGELFDKIEERTKHLTGKLVDGISIGANLRVTNTTTFRDDLDERGRVQEDQVFRSVDVNDFDIDEGVGYLQVDLIKDALTFYVDESFAPGGATNRETFGLLTGSLPLVGSLPWDAYLKAGKFFPPYGLRIQDDSAFIRSNTGFSLDNSDLGVEVGFAPRGLFLSAAVTNGDETAGDDTSKQFLVNGYYLFRGVPVLRNAMLGGSFVHNDAADRTLYALYLGANLWRFTLLAEGDLIKEDILFVGDEGYRWALYGEANYLLFDWLNVKFAYDFFDPDRDVSEDHRNRFSLGLESFLTKFLQLRLFYRVSNDIPERPQGNVAELVAEMHLFF